MSTKNSAMQQQVGGDHYKKLAIQPMEYAFKNHLDPLQFSVVKYVTRFRDKAGKQDLDKAKHCVDMLIEMEYGKQAPVGKFNPMSELPNEKEKIFLYTKDGECKLGFRLARVFYVVEIRIDNDNVITSVVEYWDSANFIGWIYANAK